MRKYLIKDRVGEKHGRLTVTGYAGSGKWNCVCDCGEKRTHLTHSLTSGNIKSCGCYSAQIRTTSTRTHGHTANGTVSRTYNTWVAMRQRCLNSNDVSFHNYGGRGIKICERWKRFENFLSDMGEKPDGTSIDRIDNNGNYAPKNCRWATKIQQDSNRRTCRIVKINGESNTITGWGRIFKIKKNQIFTRILKGWNPIEAIVTPLIKIHPRISDPKLRQWENV